MGAVMSIIKHALYIVATPIGNLADMTYRAVDVLRGVDLIIAEDTRHSKRLLDHYGISTPCLAFHEHNERQLIPQLIDRLTKGQSLALISDAGTPLISDPGYQLINAAHDTQAVHILPIPGPSAVTAALSVAGLPTDRFVFEGFLPAKQTARRRRLAALAAEPRTLVFFEAPHRILATLTDMAGAFGNDRQAAYARELTKAFETVCRAPLGALLERIRNDGVQRRGEFVIIVHGCIAVPRRAVEQRSEQLLSVLLRHLPLRTAVAIAAEVSGEKKNRLYQKAVQLCGGDEGGCHRPADDSA